MSYKINDHVKVLTNNNIKGIPESYGIVLDFTAIDRMIAIVKEVNDNGEITAIEVVEPKGLLPDGDYIDKNSSIFEVFSFEPLP